MAKVLPSLPTKTDHQLRQRVDELEHELALGSPAELDRVRQEWQTSENLLQQSQRYANVSIVLTKRDNEAKHESIEQYKIYVKASSGHSVYL